MYLVNRKVDHFAQMCIKFPTKGHKSALKWSCAFIAFHARYQAMHFPAAGSWIENTMRVDPRPYGIIVI